MGETLQYIEAVRIARKVPEINEETIVLGPVFVSYRRLRQNLTPEPGQVDSSLQNIASQSRKWLALQTDCAMSTAFLSAVNQSSASDHRANVLTHLGIVHIDLTIPSGGREKSPVGAERGRVYRRNVI